MYGVDSCTGRSEANMWRVPDAGVPIEQIARLVGHTGTTTTETVYRKQSRPVVVGSLFPSRDTDA
jgi:hypothetical protein